MWFEASCSVKLASDDTAAAGHVGTGRRRGTAVHGVSIFIEPPLGVRARNEVALSIPASDPVNAIVEEEKAQLFRTPTLVQWGIEPATAFLQFGLEHITVEDATVD